MGARTEKPRLLLAFPLFSIGRDAIKASLNFAKEPAAPLRRNGHAVNGHDEPRTLASRFKPFVVGSLIGAAVGFFAGAHM